MQLFRKKRLPLQTQFGTKADGMSDSVAQLVEQLTLNQWVEGSNPSGVTYFTQYLISEGDREVTLSPLSFSMVFFIDLKMENKGIHLFA